MASTISSSSTLGGLKEKILCGEYSVIEGLGKSDIWSRFKLVVVKNSKKCVGFVQCKDCLNFLSYEAKSGTSHLRRHKCSSESEKLKSHKVTSFFNNERSLPKSEKDGVLQACVKMCSKDLRPFDIVSGEGFTSFAQNLIQIGAKYGNLDISKVLPHPTTISRHVTEMADNLRSKLIPLLNEKIHDGYCAATTDMWTDDYKKISYTSVTVHYFNDEWNLISKLLFTCNFPDERKTGENIRKELGRRFLELGMHADALKKLIFVTDQGANIVNALLPFKRLDCMAHVLNTVLRNLFSSETLKVSNEKVFETLIGVKSLVTYLKQSGLVNMLKKTVHQDSETRWNSKLDMLISVSSQLNDIRALLTERHEEHRLIDIDVDVLTELIKFLGPFKEASLHLEKDKEITLPFVVLWHKKLLSRCDILEDDGEFITKLKSRCKDLLLSKILLKKEHKLATFLYPLFKKLRMLDEGEKKDVMDLVKKEIENLKSEEPATETEEPHKKKQKLDKLSHFSDWEDKADVDGEKFKNEIDIYMEMESVESSEDIRFWWKNQEKKLKYMSKIAKRILCIPASSASSERSFSAAGYLFQERRTRLKPEIVDASLFLHNNLEFTK